MKTGTGLATTLFVMASFPLLAQQSKRANQMDSSTAQQNPNAAEQTAPSPSASPQQATEVQLSPVNGELVSKLDSKTAKNGDSVVVQTKASVKTADGTEVPKGSKLMGHVIGVQPSGAGENSQVALQFDHFELKGGKSLPVHSQVQAIAPASGTASTSASGATSENSAGSSPASGTGEATGGTRASGATQGAGTSAGAGPAGSVSPTPGTIVGTSGKIAIRTTSVPGVMLANNAPGQQDPRMAQTSSILLGAKQDIHLDGGTQMVLGVSTATGGVQ
jgi:hypothetical protein